MKIARVTPRAVAEPGGLTYLVVRVDTDEGVSGYAETTAGPAPQVTVDQLKRELSPLVGANPFRGVQTDEALKRARASLAARSPEPDSAARQGASHELGQRALHGSRIRSLPAHTHSLFEQCLSPCLPSSSPSVKALVSGSVSTFLTRLTSGVALLYA